MTAALSDLLQPQVILDVVSRITRGQGRLGRWLGLHFTGYSEDQFTLTGPALDESPQPWGTYRIFDITRTIAQARPPGTGPGTWQEQPIGEVTYSIPRFHEKIRLNMAKLASLSPVMGPQSQVDQGGRSYLAMQEGYLAQRMNNAAEFMAACLVRGKAYFQQVGDAWFPCFAQPGSGAYVTLDYKLPAGNTAQLNMLGAGSIIGTSWDNVAAPIISHDLPAIAEAYAQLTGLAITDAFCNPTTWGSIIENTEVRNTAGSSVSPYEFYRFEPAGAGENVANPYPEMVGVLRGWPMVRWHVVSEYLIDAGGTDPTYSAGTGVLTPVIPPKTVLFMPPVEPRWVDALWYGEYVSEQPGQPAVKKPAYWSWAEWITQPTTVELITLMNYLPRLRIPKALLAPQVIFP